MDSVITTLKTNVEKIDQYLLKQSGLLSKKVVVLAKRVHQKPAHVAIVLASVFLLLLILSSTALAVSLAVFYVAYPIVCSIQLLEATDKSETEWVLVYWIVFGALFVLEVYHDLLLHFFPFYSLFKTGLLMWCMMPGPNNGSLIIYRHLLRPVIVHQQVKVPQAQAPLLSAPAAKSD